jgi:DNA processing protein
LTSACDRCLRRSVVLAELAPRIEIVATDRGGGRAGDLLALCEGDLVAALKAKLDERAIKREVEGLKRGDGSATWSICTHGPAYPSSLRHLGESRPRALFGCGDQALLMRLKREPAVTIVGSRRATGYGKSVAHELGMLLAGAGVPVISGLAFGIDSAAHRGALDAAGPTIAVLGSGADTPTPVGLSGLYRRTVEHGLVMSEMPNGFRPFRWSFPARNRIMAALGSVTVVVEAAERSGSLITVRFAQSLGREVGAVPGPINSRFSRGSNALLADGAFPVLGAEAVLDELFGPGERSAEPPAAKLDETLSAVLARVEAGDATPDAIAHETKLPPGSVAAALTRLELLGRLRADTTGRFTATSGTGA